MEKWKLVYQYHEKITSRTEEGGLPLCFESVFRKSDAICVPSRPSDIFYICEQECRRHLYWKSWGEGDPVEGPVEELIQAYEKQLLGKINDIDELVAVEEIIDQNFKKFCRLLKEAEKYLR